MEGYGILSLNNHITEFYPTALINEFSGLLDDSDWPNFYLFPQIERAIYMLILVVFVVFSPHFLNFGIHGNVQTEIKKGIL